MCRGQPSSIRLRSSSKQGSAFANCVTACVTAAVTWLTPVWAREWIKGDRVPFLHEKLSDFGFSLCSCMYLVCLSAPSLLCAQQSQNQHFSSIHFEPPVHSDMRKFHLEQKQNWTILEIDSGLGFTHIYRKRTKCGKTQQAKHSEYWLPECGSRGLLGVG